MRPVVLCLVLAGCLSAASATRVEAASITFSSGVFDLISIGNNFLGDDPTPDEMHVAAFSDTFVLTEADGVVHRTVNPFAYVVGNTGPESDAGPLVNFAVPRSFTVNGLTGSSPSISQMAQVDIGENADTYEFFAGITVTFDLGVDGFLDVTPDARPIEALEGGLLEASFQLRAAADTGPGTELDTPEPASLLLLGSGLVAGARRLRKRRTN